jgi:ParB/RepB/Spo0J family partition protein
MLRPDQIETANETAKARPGPAPDDEEAAIADLARSMRENGQIIPIVVQRRSSGYFLIDGRRRLRAAGLIDGFKLWCVLRRDDSAFSPPLRAAIHANLKRRGNTPVQNAYLCAELRKIYAWTGTAQVAQFLGKSRAWVSQHDKILHRPDGMSIKTYNSLLEKLAAGYMGADAGFYALTHVEPAESGTVLERAEEISRQPDSLQHPPTPTTPPKRRESASGKPSATPKPASKPPAIPKIEKKHVQQAARESKAVKLDTPLQKTLPDLRKMFETLRSSAYPDPIRNFISLLAGAWWRGDAKDADVVSHWTQIAMLVEAQLERMTTAAGNKVTSKKKLIERRSH